MSKVHIDCTLCTALLLGLGWGQGLTPSLHSSPKPMPGPPPFSLLSSPACPLPPRAGSLILSSWKPDSQFPLLSLLPPSLPPSSSASPSPGGLWPQGCPPVPFPRPWSPLHPGGPLQLFQFSTTERWCAEPGAQARALPSAVTQGQQLPSLDLPLHRMTVEAQSDNDPDISKIPAAPTFKTPVPLGIEHPQPVGCSSCFRLCPLP